MNVIKKWWFYYWIIALVFVLLIWPIMNDTLMVLLIGVFSTISLIINISQHIKNKTSLVKDWKFWIWLILFLPLLWLLIASFLP